MGHIFKLGTKYSKAMGAIFLDGHGKERPMIMGCYGIGVGRTIAAAIEQNHDQEGIIFPIPIAPFEAIVVPIQMNEPQIVEAAEKIYLTLRHRGLDALLDDRDVRAGSKFKDTDLLGIPLRITIGRRHIKNGCVEMKIRSEKESIIVPLRDASDIILKRVNELYDSAQ